MRLVSLVLPLLNALAAQSQGCAPLSPVSAETLNWMRNVFQRDPLTKSMRMLAVELYDERDYNSSQITVYVAFRAELVNKSIHGELYLIEHMALGDYVIGKFNFSMPPINSTVFYVESFNTYFWSDGLHLVLKVMNGYQLASCKVKAESRLHNHIDCDIVTDLILANVAEIDSRGNGMVLRLRSGKTCQYRWFAKRGNHAEICNELIPYTNGRQMDGENAHFNVCEEFGQCTPQCAEGDTSLGAALVMMAPISTLFLSSLLFALIYMSVAGLILYTGCFMLVSWLCRRYGSNRAPAAR